MVFELSRRSGRSKDELKDRGGGASAASDADRSAPLEERQKRLEERLASIAGKVWNAPNTALGLGYGLTGYGLGMLMQIGRDRDKGKGGDGGRNEGENEGGRATTRPSIRIGDNAIQFINNPLGGFGAITLGNTTTYRGDPEDKAGRWRGDWAAGEPPAEHEKQHTLQGELLGPLYLPSNILGGIYAILRGPRSGDPWHGSSNWNETGPQMNPPRPWPEQRR